MISDVEDMNIDDDNQIEGVDVIKDCLCMRCGDGNGITRVMIHKIPYFRELVIASFECQDFENCGETNNEVSFGGEIQVQGQIISLLVERLSYFFGCIRSSSRTHINHCIYC